MRKKSLIERIRLFGRSGIDVVAVLGRSSLFLMHALLGRNSTGGGFGLLVKQLHSVGVMSLVIIVVFFGLLYEWFLAARRIRAMAVDRFGSAEGGLPGLALYVGSRAYLPRRWRLPAPRVERGEDF